MKILPPPTKSLLGSRPRLVALIWLVVLLLASCTAPLQPPSPLPPGIDLRLVTNEWEVVEAVQQGETLPLDGVPHLRFRFGWQGSVFFNSGCHLSGNRMDFTDARHYVLNFLNFMAPAMECLDPLDRAQHDAFVNALEATGELSFHDDQLWLTGEETRIVLTSVAGYPAFPATEQSLILHRWRWVETRDGIGSIDLSVLPPIYVHFSPSGYLHITLGAYEDLRLWTGLQVIMLSADVYVLTSLGAVQENEEGSASQMLRPLMALMATNRYDVEDNRLILTGDGDVRVVMEIDSPPDAN